MDTPGAAFLREANRASMALNKHPMRGETGPQPPLMGHDEEDPMGSIDPQEFGELKAQVGFLVDQMKELRPKVEAIDKRMAEARGGWKVLMFLGGGAGALGAGLGAWLTHLVQKAPLT